MPQKKPSPIIHHQQFRNLLRSYLDGTVVSDTNIDWEPMVELARLNRLLPILYTIIKDTSNVPHPILADLKQETQKTFILSTLNARPLQEIGDALRNISWVLLRGPLLGSIIYNDLMLRPYGDLDILVYTDHVDTALEALANSGYSNSDLSLSNQYYRKYHLHIQMFRKIQSHQHIVELHWDVDHPFSLSTVNVAEILARRETTMVEQINVPMPEINDLLILLAIHTVKHASPLTYWLQIDQVENVIENGFLLHLLDIATMLRTKRQGFDWDAISQRSSAWGSNNDLATCLHAIDALWPGFVDENVLQRFTLARVPIIKNVAYSIVGKRAFEQLESAVFRPIRLVDAFFYLLPPASYMLRYYGSKSYGMRIRHFFKALMDLVSGGVVLIWEASRKRLTQSRQHKMDDNRPD